MMLGMAIGQALLAAKEADRENLANAIARTDFNPERVLFNAIRSGFELRTTPIEVLESADWASRIRKDEVVDLPVAVDAILDVQISSAGYYPIGRGAGFSPYFRVSARLLDMVNRGEIIDEFSYEGDYEKSSGDSRYFTTPPSLSQPSLASFEANAESIRAGLVSTFERLASKIVDDVIRVRDKQARID
jgi:hypothetical protein